MRNFANQATILNAHARSIEVPIDIIDGQFIFRKRLTSVSQLPIRLLNKAQQLFFKRPVLTQSLILFALTISQKLDCFSRNLSPVCHPLADSLTQIRTVLQLRYACLHLCTYRRGSGKRRRRWRREEGGKPGESAAGGSGGGGEMALDVVAARKGEREEGERAGACVAASERRQRERGGECTPRST